MSDLTRTAPTLMEERRLDSLRRTGILDTLPEDAYDEITDLVSQTLDVPVCLVSFVDAHRLWFKA